MDIENLSLVQEAVEKALTLDEAALSVWWRNATAGILRACEGHALPDLHLRGLCGGRSAHSARLCRPRGEMINYPYIRAWGRLKGAQQHIINGHVRRARRESAPPDAVHFEAEGRWRTFGQVHGQQMRDRLRRELQRMGVREGAGR